MPDWRRVLNELQRYSVNGKIDSGIFVNLADDNLKALVALIKAKNFVDMRKWVGENLDGDQTELFRKLYDNASDLLTLEGEAQLILLLGRYQYQAAFVADPEINTMALLTEIMSDVEFKK